THLGLERFPKDLDIKGFIFSSPYYVNAIKIPKVLLWLSKSLAKVVPKMKMPLASLTKVLTHDSAITARHFADEKDNIRATEVTLRFVSELISAQAGLGGKMSAWCYPLFAVVAGDDKLADSWETEAILKTITPHFLDYHYYPNNYHENFNESNRNIIFGDILRWLETHLNVIKARAVCSNRPE
ncbi:serine aminopeptidase domain-containing protein, partial [Pseudomonas sp.]|uniref:serine aminopeptidase domain-containing protein n=1 Tax=Pseudomonas sp. TaxID=306 RepID=UPI00273481B4